MFRNCIIIAFAIAHDNDAVGEEKIRGIGSNGRQEWIIENILFLG